MKHQLAAQEIAGGHAFDKHVIEEKEFPEIKTREEFAAHIEKVMNNPTHEGALSEGRRYYLNAVDRTIVIRHPARWDGGTAFRINPKKFPDVLDYVRTLH